VAGVVSSRSLVPLAKLAYTCPSVANLGSKVAVKMFTKVVQRNGEQWHHSQQERAAGSEFYTDYDRPSASGPEATASLTASASMEHVESFSLRCSVFPPSGSSLHIPVLTVTGLRNDAEPDTLSH